MRAGRALLVALAMLSALGARLYLATAFVGNYDEESYEIVARIMRAGGNVYAETSRYNYSPLWAYVLAGLDVAARALGVELHSVIRTALSVVDLAVAAIVAAIAGRERTAAFLRYFANPVSILLVGYHGQFENVAALPLLGAVLAVLMGGPAVAVWVLGTVSLLVKHVLLFGVWTVFLYRYARLPPKDPAGLQHAVRPFVAATLAAAVVVASLLPFWPGAGDRIIASVLMYRGLSGLYGPSAVVPQDIAFALFVPVMALLPVVACERLHVGVAGAVRLSAIALLTLIPGIGEQYFLVPVIFGAAAGGAMFWIYSGAVTLFLLTSPNNVHIIDVPPPWQLVWAVSAIWLGAALVRARRHAPAAAPTTR